MINLAGISSSHSGSLGIKMIKWLLKELLLLLYTLANPIQPASKTNRLRTSIFAKSVFTGLTAPSTSPFSYLSKLTRPKKKSVACKAEAI